MHITAQLHNSGLIKYHGFALPGLVASQVKFFGARHRKNIMIHLVIIREIDRGAYQNRQYVRDKFQVALIHNEFYF